MSRGLLVLGMGAAVAACGVLAGTRTSWLPGDAPEPAAPFVQTIPGCTTTIEMVPVPRPDASAETRPLFMATTEVPWEVFDAFVFALDIEDGEDVDPAVDAVARPSEPYISVDRGFGHAGWPALSVSHQSATAFCAWLSTLGGKHYRLPTAAEWSHVCATGTVLDEDGEPRHLKERAWYRRNADRASHPVGTRAADRYGVYDLLGNVAEWCEDDELGPHLRGGSWKSATEEVGCDAVLMPTRAWNVTDPNIPKSPWWLADGDFIGFRVVCDGAAE